jgi:hypothetical protein
VTAPVAAEPAPATPVGRRRRVWILLAAVTAALAAVGVAVIVVTVGDGAAGSRGTTSLWTSDDQPAEVAQDDQAVELGLAVRPVVDGEIRALRFFEADPGTSGQTGRLWSAEGEVLAEVRFPDAAGTGWREAPLDDPVAVTAGDTYVVSYHAPQGRYGVTPRYFAHRSVSRGGLDAPVSTADQPNGLFRYGGPGSFPDETFVGSNYWVDVVFAPSGPVPEVAAPQPPPPPPEQPAEEVPPVAEGSPLQLSAPDGGRAYTAAWPGTLPSDPEFFPLGVWFESAVSAGDLEADRAAGLNTFVALTADSDLELVEDAGMHALLQYEEWVPQLPGESPPAVAGWVLYDEVDMVEGAGTGFDSLAAITAGLPRDGLLRYNNYGKGVAFWLGDDEAARFVNDYQDLVSVDTYWFTDPNICGPSEGGALLNDGQPLTADTCRLAANYGVTIDRVRELDRRDDRVVPVWAFVEVGHPFSEEDAPTILPAQVRAAVWHSIIAGARGILYFNHSFGGECFSLHALREPCYADVREAVTATNAQITALAPVLNSWTVDGFVSVDGPARAMTKLQDDTFWVMAGATTPEGGSVTVTTSCLDDGTVVVDGEDRTLPLRDGRFTDTFADGDAVHVYRIDAGQDAARDCGVG